MVPCVYPLLWCRFVPSPVLRIRISKRSCFPESLCPALQSGAFRSSRWSLRSHNDVVMCLADLFACKTPSAAPSGSVCQCGALKTCMENNKLLMLTRRRVNMQSEYAVYNPQWRNKDIIALGLLRYIESRNVSSCREYCKAQALTISLAVSPLYLTQISKTIAKPETHYRN